MTDLKDVPIYGYHTFQGKKVSYVEAIQLQSIHKIYPEFHIYDELWDSVDCTKEPEENLDELYVRRARWIRQNYDYVILSFSGGTDSEHVFRTFYQNDIKIDEILHYHYDLNCRDRYIQENIEVEGYEHEKLSLPLIKLIKEVLCPDIKITIADYTHNVTKFYENARSNWFEDLPIDARAMLILPKQIWKIDPTIISKRWSDLINSGKKVCVVAGKEKLDIKKDDKGWYFQFTFRPFWNNDTILKPDLPLHIEQFYTHPTTIQMQLKQAHLFKKVIELDPLLLDEKNVGTRYYENKFAEACYGPRMLPLPYLAFKSKDLRLQQGYMSRASNHGVTSEWLLRDPESTAYKNWKRMITETQKLVPSFYKTDQELIDRGLLLTFSKKYYISLINDVF